MKLCDLSRSIALWGLARWQSKLHGLMHLRGPAKGGSHVARLNFRMSRVAYCQLCRHCDNLAEGGCPLSRSYFTRCHYFLGHVTCRNLPWQGLTFAGADL